ncbi:MAG: MBL fold metallo-hydrolase [Flavobacteriaceae bacterium]|nr:MBL fold metallo-hydrolase [Flavobacteriaceae bacterium]
MKKNILLLIILNIFLISCMATSPKQQSRQKRFESSPQWNGEKFQNIEPVPSPGFKEIVSMFWEFIFTKPSGGSTEKQIPAEKIDLSSWPKDQDLQFAWLGHTTFLYQIEGKWVITDPMFSQKAGSFGFLSPTRYSEIPLSVKDLPELDVVLITHNHYDHLDKDSIKSIHTKTKYFIVPLGVGEILEAWGVPAEKIIEVDWWDEKKINGLIITATPARHFSGRGLFDRDEQLWTSYAIKGEKNNIYLSGDSGWHKGLFEIGEKLGPFDVTFFEMGAYGDSKGWKEIHYTPEESIMAHKAVKGKILVPSHWATFDLAMFKWYEPIERFIKEADKVGINYLTPKLGELINPGHLGGREHWWKKYMK